MTDQEFYTVSGRLLGDLRKLAYNLCSSAVQYTTHNRHTISTYIVSHRLSVSSALNQHLQKDIAMYKNRDPLKSPV